MVSSQTIELDEKTESLCRWGAARSGAVVILPGLGTAALIVNEIYMIMRIGTVYGEEIDMSAIKGFLMAVGATFAGKTFTTLIPFPPIQIPLAVSITYAVGKAAQQWIKDGMPSDMSKYKTEAERAQKYAKEHMDDIKNDDRKDQPLGDETKEL